MVVGQAVLGAIRSHGANELPFHVHRFDGRFDEARVLKRGADGLRAMPQLQHAGACLEQERREHEKVLAAHESDLNTSAPAQDTLEVSHSRDAAESAAKDDNAHLPPLYLLLSMIASFYVCFFLCVGT